MNFTPRKHTHSPLCCITAWKTAQCEAWDSTEAGLQYWHSITDLLSLSLSAQTMRGSFVFTFYSPCHDWCWLCGTCANVLHDDWTPSSIWLCDWAEGGKDGRPAARYRWVSLKRCVQGQNCSVVRGIGKVTAHTNRHNHTFIHIYTHTGSLSLSLSHTLCMSETLCSPVSDNLISERDE